jgi:demethylmenaquinone methyltransferase/2-methoxy-6-polyprenyl-1,4-benzoquinol methylase
MVSGVLSDPVGRAASPANRKGHAQALFAGLPGRYDAVGAALSFGQDPRWRRALVATARAGPDDRVLDVATGTGLVAAELVRRYGCRVVALDQSEPMLARARARLASDPVLEARVELVRGEAEALPFPDAAFDGLTFTYLLRYVEDPAATLRELARVVRPGGRIAALDFGVPPRRSLRSLWRLYTRAVMPALGRLVSPEWEHVGRFLGPSIEAYEGEQPLAQTVQRWEQADIDQVRIRRMSFGAGVLTDGVRADGRQPQD